jgi:hypothetical protein
MITLNGIKQDRIVLSTTKIDININTIKYRRDETPLDVHKEQIYFSNKKFSYFKNKKQKELFANPNMLKYFM